ncbi:Ubiquitin carboxyl-terminal hydrolase 31 [Mactra antiquata]
MYRSSRNRFKRADETSTNLKGGLTPTLSRRQHSSETTPGEVINDEKGSGEPHQSNSNRRPLMTQAISSAQLPKWDITPGLVGLYNHGNTCFMNTILQCLSCTDVFADYFVQRKYKDVFNAKGFKRLVASSKGEVCEELGRLLESLWSGNYNHEISNQLKSIISKYNVQYKGSSQHDAQEFLLWLLDRINEELFTSKKKSKDTMPRSKKDKQTEVTPGLSSPEAVLATNSGFEVYNRFQALYQSSLSCPNCGKHSNTYESYLCLSLPVPQKSTRPVYVTVVYLDDSPKQLRIALEMNFMDTIKELREKLAHELYVTPKRLVLCQISDEGFGNTYGDDQPLSDIHESENIYVFETFPFSEINKTPGSDLIQILLVHVEKPASSKSYKFCSPEVIKIHRDINFNQLQRCILRSMRFAVSERVVEESNTYTSAIFDVRVVDCGPRDIYLPTDVDMPLYTQPIDKALSIYDEDYGPSHVKFVIEWDPEMKRSIVDNDEDQFEEHQSVHKARLGQQQPSNVSLEECLQLFTKEEKLGKGDAWQCANCHKIQEGATKKLELWSAPDVLVIHLKRFRHSGLRRNKLNTLVNFPISDLEMGHHLLTSNYSNHNDKTDLYDLYGVTNHYGNMNGGHYTAFCKNPVDMKWYEFDDRNVKPVQNSDIVTRAAYLLFYQRQTLTRNTVKNLHSKAHWVYNVIGPPRSMQTYKSSPMEEEKSIVSSPSGGKKSMEVDYSEYYVDRVKLIDSDDYHRGTRQPRGKSEPPLKRDMNDSLQKEEKLLLEQLRSEINSPRSEQKYIPLNVSGDSSDRLLNSPRNEDSDISLFRRDEFGINSPRQSMRLESNESPRRELFPDQKSNSYTDESNSRQSSRHKTSVAEQIIRSKPQNSKVNEVLSPNSVKNVYRRSDSVDSSKNSHYYTSGSDGSAPPSPLDDNTRTSAINTQQSNKKPRQSNLLNNERDFHKVDGNRSNTKLKIHSNQLQKGNNEFSLDENKKPPDIPSKMANQTANISDKKLVRPDIFSTPQQVRKSPSPPVVVSGSWSTPQPTRRQFSDVRPTIDRQYSVPMEMPVSPQNGQRLDIHRHETSEQPRSLPIEIRTSADKPPLPGKPSHLSGRPISSNTTSAHSSNRNAFSRPSTAHGSMINHSISSSFDDSYLIGHDSIDGRVTSPYEERKRPSEQRPLKVDDTSPISRGRDIDTRKTPRDVRSRNRSADRQEYSRRSVRVRNERPISYHQSSNIDYTDQYYLSQPIDDGFERTGRYATMRPARTDHVELYNEREYSHSYGNDSRFVAAVNHEPRSRAPYYPQLYQDQNVSCDMPRYQPHLQTAKYLTKLALQEKEFYRQKMKSECLKESSV